MDRMEDKILPSVSSGYEFKDFDSAIRCCLIKYIPVSQDELLDETILAARYIEILDNQDVFICKQLPEDSCVSSCLEWISCFFSGSVDSIRYRFSGKGVWKQDKDYKNQLPASKLYETKYVNKVEVVSALSDVCRKHIVYVRKGFYDYLYKTGFADDFLIEEQPCIFGNIKSALAAIMSGYLTIPKCCALFTMASFVRDKSVAVKGDNIAVKIISHMFLIGWCQTIKKDSMVMFNEGVQIKWSRKNKEYHPGFMLRVMHDISGIIALLIKNENFFQEKLKFCLVHTNEDSYEKLTGVD